MSLSSVEKKTNQNNIEFNFQGPVNLVSENINKIKMQHNGIDGFWVSTWLLKEMLFIENGYWKYKELYEDNENRYIKRRFAIMGLSIALGASVCITIGLSVGVIVFAILNYSYSRMQYY